VSRPEFFRLLCWWSLVFALVVVLPRPLFAQVTMVDPMEPYRVDNLHAVWEEGVLLDIVGDAVVMGLNEDGDPVGYRQEETFFDPTDFAAAFTEFMLRPASEENRFLAKDHGVWAEAGVMTKFNVDLFSATEEQRAQLAGWFAEHQGSVGPAGNEFGADLQLMAVHSSRPCSNGSSSSRYLVMLVDASYTDDGLQSGAAQYCEGTVADPNGAVDYVDLCTSGSSSGCVDLGLTQSFTAITGDEAAVFLPVGLTSDFIPFDNVLGQEARSKLALLTDQVDELAGYATDVYQASAYEGYPYFSLYYGFFAGEYAPPVDEGDCDPAWCDGGGSGGGGSGGGFDCAENADSVACAGTDVSEILDGEDEEVPGTEVTVESVEVEGLTVADAAGVCPADIEVSTVDGFVFEMQPLCDGLTDARPFIEMFGVLAAAVIIATSLRV